MVAADDGRVGAGADAGVSVFRGGDGGRLPRQEALKIAGEGGAGA